VSVFECEEMIGMGVANMRTVNDGEFRRAQKDFAAFITELSPLVAEKDFTIPELPSKDIVSFECIPRPNYPNSTPDLSNISRCEIFKRSYSVQGQCRIYSGAMRLCLYLWILICSSGTFLCCMVCHQRC